MKNYIDKCRECYLLIIKIIDYIRSQDFYNGNVLMTKLINELTSLMKVMTNDINNELLTRMENVLVAQENKDYVLIADMLEMSVLPFVTELLQSAATECETSLSEKKEIFKTNIDALKNAAWCNDDIIKKIENIKTDIAKCYDVEQTNIAVPTMKYCDEMQTYYYHSNINPFNEAEAFAKRYIRDEYREYVVLGLGLGYHINAMLKLDRKINVTAIETNVDVLLLAMHHIDMTELFANKRFKLIYTNEEKMMEFASEGKCAAFVIHEPSMRNLKSKKIKEKLQQYFININSMYAQEKMLNDNFYFNSMRKDMEATKKVFPVMIDKEVAYIGGGPSIEYFIDDIKNMIANPNAIVTCASTVYRRLLDKGIVPDYVFMIDGNEKMINHVMDIDNTGSVLLYLSSAADNAVDAFAGDKYIIYQKGLRQAEEEAYKSGYTLIETGGSVSTTAFDFILKSGASKLITIGLDLAYTDAKRHAYESKLDDTRDCIMAKSVTGGEVPTTRVLTIYREWIEKRIRNMTSDEKKTELINLSRGAIINGMLNCSKSIQ